MSRFKDLGFRVQGWHMVSEYMRLNFNLVFGRVKQADSGLGLIEAFTRACQHMILVVACFEKLHVPGVHLGVSYGVPYIMGI